MIFTMRPPNNRMKNRYRVVVQGDIPIEVNREDDCGEGEQKFLRER